MQQLETLAYEIPEVPIAHDFKRSLPQDRYQGRDLDRLSAVGLYYGGGGSVGSSGFLTSLRVDNVARMAPLDRGQGIPLSPSSIGYFSATGTPLGTLEQLNFEEMATLLEKYSK